MARTQCTSPSARWPLVCSRALCAVVSGPPPAVQHAGPVPSAADGVGVNDLAATRPFAVDPDRRRNPRRFTLREQKAPASTTTRTQASPGTGNRRGLGGREHRVAADALVAEKVVARPLARRCCGRPQVTLPPGCSARAAAIRTFRAVGRVSPRLRARTPRTPTPASSVRRLACAATPEEPGDSRAIQRCDQCTAAATDAPTGAKMREECSMAKQQARRKRRKPTRT